jgi:NitT/TauT family transport system substrate-binding protein
MINQRHGRLSRRQFLTTATLAGTGALLGLPSAAETAERPPELTTLKLIHDTNTVCQAPMIVAEGFLKAEGFSDVQYPKRGAGPASDKALASGDGHFNIGLAARHIIRLDAGDPIVLLAGIHIGCYELFGTERVRAIRDLKGKTVAVIRIGAGAHIFLSSMLAYVGLNPTKDINWVTHPPAESMRLLAEGKIDAFLAYPPEPQELRAKKIGHVVVNTMMDRPWHQYFCCVLAGNREFVHKHPAATKRALRAILKATDVCAREPAGAAKLLMDKGYKGNYEYVIEAMKDIPYSQWREYDPEDTVRFYSLRLQEVGMIKSSPQKIIAQGTDWRFLRELKKELKA